VARRLLGPHDTLPCVLMFNINICDASIGIDHHNSTMAKATRLIFHCSTSLQSKRCLLAYCSTYNTFFMDLPVPCFVFHSSLLTAKSVYSVFAHDGFLFVTEKFRILHTGYFDYTVAFQILLDSYWVVTS